jgi:hypothetical protein
MSNIAPPPSRQSQALSRDPPNIACSARFGQRLLPPNARPGTLQLRAILRECQRSILTAEAKVDTKGLVDVPAPPF